MTVDVGVVGVKAFDDQVVTLPVADREDAQLNPRNVAGPRGGDVAQQPKHNGTFVDKTARKHVGPIRQGFHRFHYAFVRCVTHSGKTVDNH